MKRCYLNVAAVLSAMGDEPEHIVALLSSGEPVLTLTDEYSSGRFLPLGLYTGAMPDAVLPESFWHSRNNRFALAALAKIRPSVDQAINKYGAHRVGVVIGTSTSGIGDSERYLKQRAEIGVMPDDYDYKLQEMGATASFVAREVGVEGPVYGISTACSSGAKALASGRRLIQAGVCDAVIVGGVDTLCHLTVQGFSSLEAVSETQCNPFSANRSGINIGEGAALFLMSGEPQGVELAGIGESSDAHHISAPDPSGQGAARCMTAALADAGITASQVGYINLHGTATALNDQMESRAVDKVFGCTVSCSSTKPFTGHTLGAAGALEAGICWLALQYQFIPRHVWDGEADPELPPIKLATESGYTPSFEYALSNSFAFGGNNISLVLKRLA